MRKGLLFLTSFFYLFASSTLFAWNAIGHMVVAEIAYKQLAPEAKTKIDQLTKTMHAQYPDLLNFQEMSYWPDALRAQKIETYIHWHYIDKSFSDDGTPLKNLTDTDNAVWAYQLISKVVANDRANPSERVRFLSFLTHIVADLHQPLHTVSKISANHPDGDQGGNLFNVSYKKKRTNLHHVWDTGVGSLPNGTSDDTAAQIATELMTQYPKSYFGKDAEDLNTDHWLEEGMVNAKKYVYDTSEGGLLSSSYIQRGKEASAKELALAGYRLGFILNQLVSA